MSDTPLGRFCWFELLTTDPDAAAPFYQAVLGWSTMEHDAGEKPYTMWVNGETPVGGVMALPPEAVAGGAPPHWLAYISTPDAAGTKAKAEELGANAVIATRFTTSVLMGGAAELLAVGTAVVVEDA